LFLKHHPQKVHFSGAFILNNSVQASKYKSIFIEFTRFSSLFLVNFHVFILNESHHLLIKRSCKTDGENLDGF